MAFSALLAPKRPPNADTALSSALPFTTSIEKADLIDIATLHRPPSPVVSPPVTSASAPAGSRASVPTRLVIDHEN